MPVKLEFLFQAERGTDEYIPFHHHQCYELVYYLTGDGSSRIGETEWSYRPGEFALMRPMTVHDEHHLVPTTVLCLGFSPAEFEQPLPEGVFPESEEDGLLPLLHSMKLEMQLKKPGYTAMLDLLAGQLWIRLTRILQTGSPSDTADKLHYARKYIDENFSQKIDFMSMATMTGYSYDRFRHVFKNKVGLSPQQYVLRQRLEHAKKLLRHSDLSVTAVAMECGFSSDAQFCRMFKRELGTTPGQYRR